jgi:transcriptional regulator with XRE-family HTH domain
LKKETLFGENFKKYRKRKGISQKEFASLLCEETGKQLTLTSISNYETGLHLPSPQILPIIAEILGVSLDALFGTDKALFAGAGEQELSQLRVYRREMEALQKEFTSLKSRLERKDKNNTAPVKHCERLLEIIESQQSELLTGQVELAAVRKMIALFRNKL